MLGLGSMGIVFGGSRPSACSALSAELFCAHQRAPEYIDLLQQGDAGGPQVLLGSSHPFPLSTQPREIPRVL